jgi:hypothetical protein
VRLRGPWVCRVKVRLGNLKTMVLCMAAGFPCHGVVHGGRLSLSWCCAWHAFFPMSKRFTVYRGYGIGFHDAGDWRILEHLCLVEPLKSLGISGNELQTCDLHSKRVVYSALGRDLLLGASWHVYPLPCNPGPKPQACKPQPV